MTKSRIALLGSAMIGAALLCGAPARAQDYDSPAYTPAYPSSYDYERQAETVIVHPYYDRVEQRQLLGHINGEVDPVERTISRPVNFSDLNPAREADYIELRARVSDTARDLCAELDARFPELAGDRSADRECVRNATRDAMRAVMEGVG